jgi:hypothetical protein
MHILLCILLYLRIIVSPGTYTIQYINDLEQSNLPVISTVDQNSDLLNEVEQIYNDDADRIVIIDTTED